MVVDIFWLVVGGGGYILDSGGWWWVAVGRGGMYCLQLFLVTFIKALLDNDKVMKKKKVENLEIYIAT